MSKTNKIYGLLAQFDTTEQLVAAAGKVREAGYLHCEAYSPFPVHGLAEALGFTRSRIPMLVLVGGLIGASGGFFMEYYANSISFPWNIGGRPHLSWPAFIPITFELGVLCAAFSAVLGMLALNGLPQPYHPLFNASIFQMASRDKFFICIESRDVKYDTEQTRQFLESLHPSEIVEVPA
jgi:hypothetical protein